MLRATMRGAPNIILVGPMGSGKTAVGRSVARHLGRTFYDSDTEIVRRTGVDIPYIFEKEGEAGFREREREAIEALVALRGIVLATGGGAVLLPANRLLLAQRGYVVYLETSVEQQVERVKHGRNRPLLSNVDPATRLEELMAVRDPLYREIADICVATDGRRVKAVADDIVRMIR
jgi:shikimate kinase